MVKEEKWSGHVGSFNLIDTKKKFARYITHKNIRDIIEVSDEISAWAEENGFVSSNPLQTQDSIYSFEKRCEIYIVKPEHTQYINRFEKEGKERELLSEIRLPSFNPKELSLAISQKQPYGSRKRMMGVSIDINKELVSEHTNIIQALESILKNDETNP